MSSKFSFSLYDFLGYIIPGTFMIYMFQLFFELTKIPLDFFTVIQKYNNISILGNLDTYLFFITVAYIIGHAINYISSITIEKYAIWMFDYPSEFLLTIKKVSYLKKDLIFIDSCDFEEYDHNLLFKIKLYLFNSRFEYLRRISKYKLRSSIWRILLWIFILPVSLLDYFIGKLGGLRCFYTNQMDSQLAKIVILKKK